MSSLVTKLCELISRLRFVSGFVFYQTFVTLSLDNELRLTPFALELNV